MSKAIGALIGIVASIRRHFVPALIFFLTGLVMIAGFIPFSLVKITRQVEQQAARLTGGDTLRVGTLAIQLWKGVSLQNVYYSTRVTKQPAIRLTVPRVLLTYRLLPLLWGKIDVHKMTVSDPSADLVLPPPAPASAPGRPGLTGAIPLPMGKIPLDLPVNLEIHDLAVRNARLNVVRQPDLKIIALGVDLDLSASLDKTLSAEGRLGIDSLFAPHPCLLTGFQADLSLAPGKVGVSRCGFSVYEGQCRMNARLDSLSDTLVQASFSLQNLRLSPLLQAARFNRGKVDGKIALEMSVNGNSLDPFQWRGKGAFRATKMELSGLPFQNTLATLFFLPALRQLKFDQVSTSLNLSNGRISTPDLKGLGNMLDFTGAGWVGLNTIVSEKVRISLSSEMCAHLPPLVSREILQPGPDGRCETGGELSGPLSNLTISLDKKTRDRAAEAIIREAGSLLKNLLRKR